ncbi:hypothetical protein SAY87_031869 [Trapa incisa]|uniref:C2H2-type domain-containing protein n=1 Tax=Trapa incisa TaxID=236973 RepID=A0AAN7KYI3_9MYRT|nr:hypothetical protein SAY87_031869 [Trapa incisa]
MEQMSASIREKAEHIRADASMKKSYSCSFCKRDFLNPQALGGHMNVHRKDRAKLMMQSLDDESDDVVPEKNEDDPAVGGGDDDDIHGHAEYSGCREEASGSKKSACVTVSREDRGVLEQLKSTEKQQKEDGPLEEKRIDDELKRGRSLFPLELDLELRLGHEAPPPHSQPSEVRAKKLDLLI